MIIGPSSIGLQLPSYGYLKIYINITIPSQYCGAVVGGFVPLVGWWVLIGSLSKRLSFALPSVSHLYYPAPFMTYESTTCLILILNQHIAIEV